ncbi:MAG: winged helix-turn-helix domain-containing protein [Candidatus Eremiobacteraeota bacterium]|nr:winged helix-turn-helix domain-containing protein [Candidatus Eremiobacteraeota bacterium]
MEQLEREKPAVYHFDGFELDVATSLLRYRDHPVALGPRVVQTLLALAQHVGEIVSKEQLLEIVWPDGWVEEANLSQNIYVLRKMIRACGARCRIETIPRRGYRLIADMTPLQVHQFQPAAMRRRALRWPLAVAAAIVLMTIAAGSSHSQGVFARPLSAQAAREYALGRYYWNLRTNDGLAKSVRYFSDVTRSDPYSALGYAGLADAYSMIEDYSCAAMACKHVVPKARANALKALQLDSNSAEAHTAYAMILEMFDHRLARSDAEYVHAIELNPNYALAHQWYGQSLLMHGKMAEGRAQLQAAIALQPVAMATNAWLGIVAYYDRRYRDAIAYLHQALDLNPNHEDAVMILGLAQEGIGHYRDALASFTRFGRSAHHIADAELLIAEVYARTGRTHDALAAVQRAQKYRSVEPYQMAFVFIALGQRDRALHYMSQTKSKSRDDRVWLAMDPRLDPVRGDARFRHWVKAG